MKVGFIGLGRMGQSMALNLLRAGRPLTVFDTDPDAATPLVAAGARLAADVAELTREVDVLFTSLPGPPQIEEVVLGPAGVLANLSAGMVLFDLSTSSVSLAQRIDAAFAQAGSAMLDAPVSGGPAGAASGELALWVGGDREVYEQNLDLLHDIGRTPRYVGGIGSGLVTKLAHNLVGYVIMESLAEVFAMAVKAGMDPLELWEALRLGVVGRQSPLDMLVNQFLPGEYETPAFLQRLAHKDVTLATDLGKQLGVPMRLSNLTLEEMTEALGRGFGEQDSRAYLKLQLERSGVAIAVDHERVQQAVTRARTGATQVASVDTPGNRRAP